MRIERGDAGTAKGWYLGPWNSDLGVAIGWATAAIDEPHLHCRMTEVYLVGRGTAQAQVERDVVRLGPGDVLVVEPGEAHTFTASSPDYLHFVLHLPALPPEEARSDKVPVPPHRLGLEG
jgi:mannose-6-phosphate isomerase-like protein (cupin superfamily)